MDKSEYLYLKNFTPEKNKEICVVLPKDMPEARRKELQAMADNAKSAIEQTNILNALKKELHRNHLDIRMEDIPQKTYKMSMKHDGKNELLAVSMDGDMEDGYSETLIISGKLSRSEQRKIKAMAEEMRDIDRRMDTAQKINDPVALNACLREWDSSTHKLSAYLTQKNITVKKFPKKDLGREAKKIDRYEEQKQSTLERRPVKINQITHKKEQTRGMERERTLSRTDT